MTLDLPPGPGFTWAPSGPDLVVEADNLPYIRRLPDGAFRLVYLDPPFNTGRSRERTTARGPHPPLGGTRMGFRGRPYDVVRSVVTRYDDDFADYWAFLEPRLEEAWRLLADDGTLYLHLDQREVHYAKVLLDALFGRDCFLNEIVWAYDYGARTTRRWPAKHDTILVYVKDPERYLFDTAAVDREPYMAPVSCRPRRPRSASCRPTSGGTRSSRRREPRRRATPRRSRSGCCGGSSRPAAHPATGCSTSSPAAGRRASRPAGSAGGSCSSTRTRMRSR